MHPTLKALRGAGWTVAVHNDYRQDGELRTFWLLTHEQKGFFVKAEGPAEREEAVLEELQAKASKLIRLAVVEAEVHRLAVTEAPIVFCPGCHSALYQDAAEAGVCGDCEGTSRVPAPAPKGGLAEQTVAMHLGSLKVTRRDEPIPIPAWETAELLTYFGALRQIVLETRAEKTVSAKDRQNMRRLLAWLKLKDTKRLIEFSCFQWTTLKKAYSIKGPLTVSLLYGFRQSFLEAMEKGFEADRPSRTHRSTWSEEDAPSKPQKIFG